MSKNYELVKIEENTNNIVKKHQQLVHHARYKLSELGIKVLSVLISRIKVSDHEFEQYAIKISDFKALVGSDSKKTYEYTHKLISELMSNPMHLGDEQFNWVSYGKYVKGSNLVIFEVHRLLKPYLLELKNNFLQYNITNILPLKSTYVIRLYEICKDHWNEGNRYKKVESVKFDMRIERMREQFNIPKSYLYKDIRVNIIDKAVKQLAAKTDIKISYEEQKIGRKVDRIIIRVSKNNKGSADPLSSRKEFIQQVRDKYKPSEDKYPTIVSTAQGDLKIDHSGRLYIIKTAGSLDIVDYTSIEANKLWDWLYQGVKNGDFKLM